MRGAAPLATEQAIHLGDLLRPERSHVVRRGIRPGLDAPLTLPNFVATMTSSRIAQRASAVLLART